MEQLKKENDFSTIEIELAIEKLSKVIISNRTYKNQIVEFLRNQNLTVQEMISLNQEFLQIQSRIFEFEFQRDKLQTTLDERKKKS